MKEQKEAIKSGKLKISSAAAKLNESMMGIEDKSEDKSTTGEKSEDKSSQEAAVKK